MSFESPDMAKDFPGLYRPPGPGTEAAFEEEDKPLRKKDLVVRRRDSRPERRGKGYTMFNEEDSEEELVAEDSTKSPSKMKKHSKPSFKFAKREKFYKPKEKDKERDVHHQYGTQTSRERDKSGDKFEKGDGHKKDEKKKDERLKWRKRKLLGPGATGNIQKTEQLSTGAPESELRPIFGVALSVAVDRRKCHDAIQLPVIFRECVDYIEEIGLACEGIYRISGVKSKVTALKDQYNQHMDVYLHEHEPNTVASLLKLYLRELPEPVLTKELMPKFEEASTAKNVKQKVELFQQIIEQLPIPNKLLLSWMIVHMTHVISKEKLNKMSLQNVSIVLSPTMQISHRVLNVLFTYARILFKDTVIKRYVLPLKPVTSKWSLDLPESPPALEEELLKQESLLSQLHEDVMKRNDTDKEEQLWEVQRVVTQLKRKIKHVKKTQQVELSRKEEILDQKQEQKPQRTQQAMNQDSVKQQAVNQDSVKQQAVNQDSVKQQAVNQDSVNQQAVNQDSVKQQAVNQDSVKQQDLKTSVTRAEVEPTHSSVASDTRSSQPPITTDETESKNDSFKPETDKGETGRIESEVTSEMATADVDETEPVVDGPGDVKDAEGGSRAIEASLERVEERVAADSPLIDSADDQHDSDDDLTPTENSEGFGEKIVDSTRSSDVDIHQAEPLADTPDTPQVEPAELFPGDTQREESASEIDVAEGEVHHVLAEPPGYRRISSSSEEERQEEEEIRAEVHAEAELRPLDDSDVDYIPTPLSSDEETDMDTQQHQYSELLLEEEELLAMGDELRQKIEREQSEIGRLHQEIEELKSIREDLYDSEDASSDSSQEFEDEEDLHEILRELTLKNKHLEVENQDLSCKIQQEQQICLDVKVQIRMIQQRQLESSGGMLLMDGISESNALIESLL